MPGADLSKDDLTPAVIQYVAIWIALALGIFIERNLSPTSGASIVAAGPLVLVGGLLVRRSRQRVAPTHVAPPVPSREEPPSAAVTSPIVTIKREQELRVPRIREQQKESEKKSPPADPYGISGCVREWIFLDERTPFVEPGVIPGKLIQFPGGGFTVVQLPPSFIRKSLPPSIEKLDVEVLSPSAVHREDEDDEPGEENMPVKLTQFEWLNANDANHLLGHAVPLIPVRHTCLVVAELAQQLWPYWHEEYPEDWRPAWCIATLRAWCFGEATLAQVRAARDASLAAKQQRRPRDREPFQASTAAWAAAAATTYAFKDPTHEGYAFPAFELLAHVTWALAERDPMAAATAFAWMTASSTGSAVTETYSAIAEELHYEMKRRAEKRQLAVLADVVRNVVPYPVRASRQWELMGREVLAGDARLQLDGWRIRSAWSKVKMEQIPRCELN